MRGRDLGGMGALGNQWHSALVEAKVYVFFLVQTGWAYYIIFETLRFYNYNSEMRGRDLGGMGGLGNRWHSALVEAKVYVFFFSANRLGLL